MDVERFVLSAQAEQDGTLGTVTVTPEPMAFATHREAMVALSEWIFDGCMPLAGRITKISATITPATVDGEGAK